MAFPDYPARKIKIQTLLDIATHEWSIKTTNHLTGRKEVLFCQGTKEAEAESSKDSW